MSPKRTAYIYAPADFGLAVRQARIDRGLSQNDLADRVGMPQSTISEIESGKSTIFIRRLLSLFAETGVNLTATWDGPDESRR